MEFIYFVFVLGLVVTVSGAVYYALKDHRARTAASRASAAEEREWLTKLARLEDRVEVLERIVTDERSELRRQFRELG